MKRKFICSKTVNRLIHIEIEPVSDLLCACVCFLFNRKIVRSNGFCHLMCRWSDNNSFIYVNVNVLLKRHDRVWVWLNVGGKKTPMVCIVKICRCYVSSSSFGIIFGWFSGFCHAASTQNSRILKNNWFFVCPIRSQSML